MSSIKVIYAEDDMIAAEMILYKLKKADIEVIFFRNGEGVYEAARKEKPDVVLLDLMMPRKSGYAVLKELKDDPETLDIPVIIFSALDHTQEYKSISFKYADYILKPCSPEAIIPRILNCCAETRLKAVSY